MIIHDGINRDEDMISRVEIFGMQESERRGGGLCKF